MDTIMMYNLFRHTYKNLSCSKFVKDWDYFIKYEWPWII